MAELKNTIQGKWRNFAFFYKHDLLIIISKMLFE